MLKKFSLPELGLEVEIGKFARQANGAAWIKSGKNIVLATAVAASEPKDFMGFFPLSVQYRELVSAAGKIPGGYLKREGRLSDREVLTSRLIDRPIRPLFPSDFFNEVQVLATVYSSDGNFPVDILAMIGSSLALVISDIPFLDPVGAVQACRIANEWHFNPSHTQISSSDTLVTIAGTKTGISMVEGYCNNLPEEELIKLLLAAHDLIKQQVEWQLAIQKECGKEKMSAGDGIDWAGWTTKVKALVSEQAIENVFGKTKSERSAALDALQSEIVATFNKEIEAGIVSGSVIKYLCGELVKEVMPNVMAKKKQRIDMRNFEEVRLITSEVSLLPCVHGSATFLRGETQAITSLTLGTAQDAQKVDTLLGGTIERSFMLHYNFLPFATGEVKPMRGVGRREVGHGYLAEQSFMNVLPDQKSFPYTIRAVVDILESNGSSSMATVCATTLALMDAGVPIKEMVSGVAMGMIKDSSGNYHILTDILGTEDALGLMDFKVTGTDHGIMAFQLDVKSKIGLSQDLLVKALTQAKVGRLHILQEMRKTMTAPRDKISDLAPQIFTMKVPQDKIGAIIGPGGKNIKEIVAKTEAQIDIEDDGTINIYAHSTESARAAEAWIRTLVGEIEVGSEFEGIIKKVAEFGLFVELVAGKEGLVHISSIPRDLQRNLNDNYRTGDKLKVQVVAYEKSTGRVRLSLVEPK
ncbi:MAG: polyribonucleotide nucleotidyltransferase [bacterium]